MVAMLRWLRSGSMTATSDGHDDESGDRSHHRPPPCSHVRSTSCPSPFHDTGAAVAPAPPGHQAQWGA